MKKQLATCVIGLCSAFNALAQDGGVIADFEDGVTRKPSGPAFTAELVTDKEHVKEGASALKLAVNYGLGSAAALKFKFPQEIKVSKETGKVSMWVFGDGAGANLSFSLEAEDKGLFSVVKPIDWQGWQELVIPLTDFKFNVHSTTTPPEASKDLDSERLRALIFIVYNGISSIGDTHTFYFDSIKLVP